MARKKESEASTQPNPLGWMVTFSDLVTLLLTFFVLLIAMSSMDVKALKDAFGLFSGGSGPLAFSQEGKMEQLTQLIARVQEVPSKILLDQQEIKEMIFQFQDVDYQKLLELVDRDITVSPEQRGLVIQMADYILFYQGGSELRREYLPLLSRLAVVLRGMPFPVSIEGHTDTSEAEGGREARAWRLSLDRAMAVLKYFVDDEGLLPERFRVGGYGPSKPLFPNTTPQNRAKNRRIEIVIHKEQLG